MCDIPLVPILIGTMVSVVVIEVMSASAPEWVNVYIALLLLGFIVANKDCFSTFLGQVNTRLGK